MSVNLNPIRRVVDDQSGNVAITFGLMIIPALMFIGGAIDFGNAFRMRQKLQNAADAGTLAAASLPRSATAEDRRSIAINIFNANTAGIGGLKTVTNVDGDTVSLTATGPSPTGFLKLANIDAIDVGGSSSSTVSYHSQSGTSTATTTETSNGRVCLLALDPGSTIVGFSSQGTPEVHYENCWAHTNSTLPGSNNSGAISAGGEGAYVIGAGTSAVGGKSPDADSVYHPAPLTGQSEVSDPFARVSAYATPSTSYQSTFTAPSIPSSCKSNGLNLKKNKFTLDPGRYCGGITVMANATVKFNPGVYIIDNGKLEFQSGAKVSGDDVLFYLIGSASGFTIIGAGNGGNINLKGRTSGSDDLKGFVLIAHPDAWRGLTSNIQGSTILNVEGMIYAPTQHITITGGGSVNANSNFFSLVAKSFQFQGNGRFDLKAWNSSSNMPDISPTKALTTTSTTTSTTTTDVVDKVQLR